MGVWTLRGQCEGKTAAVMVDSVTMQAFGPLFGSQEDCDDFVEWCLATHGDPRGMSALALESLREEWWRGLSGDIEHASSAG